MKLKRIYQEIVKKGIEADIRKKSEIENLLKENKKKFERLSPKEKEFFDKDSLFNPFSDTRILCGDEDAQIKSLIVGIDVDGGELCLVDRLNERGKKIDLVVSHHPQGKAFAAFYEVMDLQVDIYHNLGVSLGFAEGSLSERRRQVERRVNAANHQRSVDIARLLGLNFLCAHTPCDNLAYQFLRKLLDREKPRKLSQVMDLLYSIQEYQDAARDNNPPKIIIGDKNSRCENIHLEFTGGTEGPQDIYERLSSAGIDTIVAMHQSEEHFKKSKSANINVIFASHIASDTLGINCMLDYLETKEKFKIYCFSGFRRFKHKGTS